MDETGHSGDTGAADGGNGAEARERSRVNGWTTSDSPWSYPGTGLETDGEVPAWRRPVTEMRSFPRNPAFPSSAVPVSAQPSSGVPAPAPAPAPPGFVDARPSGEIPPSEDNGRGVSRWDLLPTYADRSAPASPGGEPPAPREPGLTTGGRDPGSGTGAARDPGADPGTGREPGPSAGREPGSGTGAGPREPGLGTGAGPREPGLSTGAGRAEPGLTTGGALPAPGRPTSLRGFDVPTPSSAPPYPYEGDLDDAAPEPPPAPLVHQRTAVPLVRPATPGGRRAAAEPSREAARHALTGGTPLQGMPRVAAAEEPAPVRPAYDPSSFPRRLSYEPREPQPPYEVPKPYEPPPPYSGFGSRGATTAGLGTPSGATTRVLPQRVPAQPDVPQVPEPPLVEPTAETPALARIATHLRRGDVRPVQERQEGFDVKAILAAVRGVDGVRDASLRSTPAGAHSLRLDLSEGADPAEVSRRVARLLQDRMGLDAAMQGETPPAGAPSAPEVPSARPAPEGRPAPETPGRAAAEPLTRPESLAGAESRSRPDALSRPEARTRPEARPEIRPASETFPRLAPESLPRPASAPPARQSPAPAPVSPALPAARPPLPAQQASAPPTSAPPAATPPAATPPAAARPVSAPPVAARPVSVPPVSAPPASAPPIAAALSEPQFAEPRFAEPQSDDGPRSGDEPQSGGSRRSGDEPRSGDETRSGGNRRSDDEARSGDAVRSGDEPAAPVAEHRTPALERHAHAPDRPSRDRPPTQHDRPAQHERPVRPAPEPVAAEVVPAGADCGPPRPLYPGEHPGPRIVIENVHVNTFGSDATVEVRLAVGDRTASGTASGPAVDGYLLRLCAMATAGAVDELLASSDHPDGPARCFVEHAAAVPFGAAQVAVVVLLLSCGGWVEQLAGSAVVTSDDRHAMVRATLAAVNRRLEALLSR